VTVSPKHYKWRGSRTFPPDSLPEKIANSVVEIEAGMMKPYLLSRSWIDEIILY